MRRFGVLLIAVILLGCTVLGVSAATSAPKISNFSTVSGDGSCQVALSVTIRLEEPVEKLTFPIPANATGVTLNGSRVSAPKDGNVSRVQLGKLVKNITGDITINIHYVLRDVIHTNENGGTELRLELLSGFEHPVQAMEFSVTLPGQVDTLPSFSSGYHKASIEKDLTFAVEGATISGAALKALKDHETLTMTLAVPAEMFPRAAVEIRDYHVVSGGVAVCAGLALVYWLLALGSMPVRRQSCTQSPPGFRAGQLGSILAMQGTDLNLTVLSWAQMGYLTPRLDRKGNVRLHKRMEMGNECSAFERRYFQKVFGRNLAIDTSGYRYAMLCREAGRKPMGMGELIHRRSGSTRIFRTLLSGMGVFGGAAVGISLGGGAVLQWLLILLLAGVGGVAAWMILGWLTDLMLGRGRKALGELLACGVWLLASAGEAFALCAWTVAGLLLGGVLLFWSGRRTPEGKLARGQILALRRYLRTLPKEALAQICREDPDYFFRMAPVALALGVDRQFAARFGKQRFAACPYLSMDVDANMTAQQWNEMLRRALAGMRRRAERLPMERFMGFVKSLYRR